MKKIFKLLLVGLLCTLSACGSSSSDEETSETKTSAAAISSDMYTIAIPFSSSDATQVHVNYNRSSYDLEAIGEGLQRYSQDYFSTSKYYLQDGQLLDQDDLLSSTSDLKALLGRKSEDNEYGLNPEKGTTLPVDDDTSITVGTATVTVNDIVEYDFYTSLDEDAEIAGLAFAIVLSGTVEDDDGNEYELGEEQLQIIGEEAARNLMTYVKDLVEVNASTPVLMCLFVASSSDDTLPGMFFSMSYGTTSLDTFTDIDEQWVLLPSDEAEDLDVQLSSSFDNLKEELFDFLTNDVAIVGKALFIDEDIYELNITVTTQGKTQIQNQAVVQYINQLLDTFDTGYTITVTVNANTSTYAMLQRDSDSDDVTVIMQ